MDIRSEAKGLFIYFFIISLFFSGCGMWGNLTTYFNRYYNSKKAFDKAEEIISEQERDLFSYREEKIPNTADKELEAVIEKCSNILQFDPNSGYVSDALFMVGRAFYYQQNYSKALRKFNELAAKNDEDFNLINKLWIGKTELKMRSFDEGIQTLDEVKESAAAEEKSDILAEAYIAQISYLIYREDDTQAISNINKLLEITDSDELKADIVYELGNLYAEIDSLQLARQAYLEVDEYSPTFETQFNSKLKFAELSRKLGSTEEALEFLDDLRYEGKFQNDRDRVEVEIALITMDQGDINKAESMLMEIDTTYSKKPSSGVAAYNLGLIQENYYKDLDSASFYYEKAMKVANLPLDIKNLARKKDKQLGQYKILAEQLEKQELQLVYFYDNEKFLQDSVDYVYLQEQKRIEAEKKNPRRGSAQVVDQNNQPEQQENKTVPSDSVKAASDSVKTSDSTAVVTQGPEIDLEYSGNIVKYLPVRPKLPEDSLRVNVARSRYDLANLFLTEFEVADSAYKYYNLILKDDPDGPMTAKTLYALGSYNLTVGDSIKADSLFQYVYDTYPNDDIAIEAAKRLGKATTVDVDLAEKMFENAENDYLNEKYEESVDTLYSIYEKYPESDYAPKSLYTIGYLLFSKMNMIDSAVAVYDTLSANYQRSVYTLKVTPMLAEFRNEQKRIQDSLQQAIIADSLYADSLRKAELGIVDSLVSDSLAVSDSSVIIDSTINIDSTAVTDSLSLPDSLKIQEDGRINEEEDGRINEEEDVRINEDDDDVKPIQKTEKPKAIKLDEESEIITPLKEPTKEPGSSKPPKKDPEIEK